MVACVAQQGGSIPKDQISSFGRLVLHLIIRVDELIVLVLIVILALELGVGLGEVDCLAARARALNDVRRLDLLHVVLVGLLSCSR
jgi:hypothetical protein